MAYQCRFCPKQFGTEAKRGRHEAKRHPGQPLPEPVKPDESKQEEKPPLRLKREPAALPLPEPGRVHVGLNVSAIAAGAVRALPKKREPTKAEAEMFEQHVGQLYKVAGVGFDIIAEPPSIHIESRWAGLAVILAVLLIDLLPVLDWKKIFKKPQKLAEEGKPDEQTRSNAE